MSDDADRASELEQMERDNALQQQIRHAGLLGKTEADSALRCGCGQEISEARRRAVPGCRLCVVCKERQERWNKGRA